MTHEICAMLVSDLDVQRSAYSFIRLRRAMARAWAMVQAMRAKVDDEGADTWLRMIAATGRTGLSEPCAVLVIRPDGALSGGIVVGRPFDLIEPADEAMHARRMPARGLRRRNGASVELGGNLACPQALRLQSSDNASEAACDGHRCLVIAARLRAGRADAALPSVPLRSIPIVSGRQHGSRSPGYRTLRQ